MEAPDPMTGDVAGYEFAPPEESVIHRTAIQARLWGAVILAGGVLGALALVPMVLARPATGVLLLIAPGLYLFVGARFFRAGNELRAVVATRGRDVDHLIAALDKLGDALFVLNTLTLAALVVLVAGMLLLGVVGPGI